MKKEKNIADWKSDSIIPKATRSYQPVPHLELIRMIILELNKQGYSVLTNHVSQNGAGTEIVGHMSLTKYVSDDDSSLAFTQMFAYMNSYNKRLPIKLVAGACVFVCGNGMVVGEIFEYRKHTSGIDADLPAIIRNAVSSIEKTFLRTVHDVECMQRTMLSGLKEKASLLGQLFIEKQFITSTELNIVVDQIKNPKYPDFTDDSVWSLYNHLTYALKEAPPSRRMNALKDVHRFLADYSGADTDVQYTEID